MWGLCDEADEEWLQILLDILELYELVHDRIDGQSARAVYLQFLGDVAPVGDDGVSGEVELSSYLLIGHPLDDTDDDLPLPWSEALRVGRRA